ncbi:hypothetical protein HDV05_004350 [Chytridiales sp. JEL 0842]|nr:hypothetical protein HDV05_004350 [Chytridiales sp. JEL 0842]
MAESSSTSLKSFRDSTLTSTLTSQSKLLRFTLCQLHNSLEDLASAITQAKQSFGKENKMDATHQLKVQSLQEVSMFWQGAYEVQLKGLVGVLEVAANDDDVRK